VSHGFLLTPVKLQPIDPGLPEVDLSLFVTFTEHIAQMQLVDATARYVASGANTGYQLNRSDLWRCAGTAIQQKCRAVQQQFRRVIYSAGFSQPVELNGNTAYSA
jgi:hypothetical protein